MHSRRNNPIRVAKIDPDKLRQALAKRNAKLDPYTSSDYWKQGYSVPTNRKHMPYDRDRDDITELD